MPVELDKLAGPKGGEKGREIASHWLEQINTIKDSAEYKRWVKRGEAIEKRYRDERNRTDDGDGGRRYSSLWSNTEILKPALYGRTPLPVAERRFRDKDPTGRAAAQILERALRNEIEICGYDEAMQQVVTDYLLPGRGTVWVRYEPMIEESVSLPVDPHTDMDDDGDDDDATEAPVEVTAGGRQRASLAPEAPGAADDPEEVQEKLDSTGDRVVRESTPVDFIYWKDFMTFPARARSWKEVTAIAKLVYFSKEQTIKRFGKEIGKAVPLERDSRGQRDVSTMQQGVNQDKTQIYEIWDKTEQCVYWVAVGYQYLLDRKDDPLKLEHFFPVPRPLYSNATNNTLIPVPDYIQYQDQAIQIDELTQRIAMLTKACKMAGVYNAAAKDIQRLFNEGVENTLIPVDDWSAFSEKGGIEGNWSLMPVKDVIGIINELMVCKQKQVEEMDRLTGINDIMRGTSDARETLGGVRLKVNSTGTRLTSRQNEVARFARDVVRIMADIMSQWFSPQSLIEASGALYEEGLGPDDMPGLAALQDPAGMAPPPAPPALAPPGGAPMPPMAPRPPMPGAGPGMPPGAPPSPFPGGANVVPFRGPMPPSGMPSPGMPPMGPMAPPAPPPMPPEVMAKMAALQRIAKALMLLRNEKLRGFRVDIEVDSTIFPDAAQEKDDRTAFLTAVTSFLTTSVTLGAQAPEVIPLMAKMLQFGVRGYRVGRDLETAIEEFSDQAVGMAKQLIQKRDSQPNPEQQKIQLEQQRLELDKATTAAKVQGDQAKTEGQKAITAAKIQGDQQAAAADLQHQQMESASELQRQALENEGERQNAMLDLQSNQIDLEIQDIAKEIEEKRLKIEELKLKQARAKPKPTAGSK